MQSWIRFGVALALAISGAGATAESFPKDDAVPLPEGITELPAPIQPYTTDGRYEPADFGWMRGSFTDASADEKTSYAEVKGWLEHCYATGNAASAARISAMGVSDFQARGNMGVPTVCVAISSQPDIKRYRDFADFSAAVSETQPIFDALLQSVWLAEQIGGASTNELADLLKHRTLGEQMLRNAWSWVRQREETVRPLLSERQNPVFSALLTMEIVRFDMANTAWLQRIVAEKGWPTRSMVGEDASRHAWLIAQHADHAPAFQLDVLRLMEPLVAEKEVSPRDYAYLYDRTMLKLVGKQRYATQMWCKDGKMEPQPLENADRVEDLRAEMTLVPFDEYRKNFPATC